MSQFILVVLCFLFVVNCNAFTCQYHSNLENSKEKHPCNDDEIDDQGRCSKIMECTGNKHVRQNFCFASWRNDSGVIKLEKQGCTWGDHNAECIGRSTCGGFPRTSNIYYCCCDTAMCNLDFYANATTEVETTTATTEKHIPEHIPEDMSLSQDKLLLILVCTLVPISLIFIAIFIILRRRSKKRLKSFNDTDSAETPSSGVTTSTSRSDLPLLTKQDFTLPQLIEMKARGRFGCVWKAQLKDHFVAVKTFCLQDKQSWLNEQEIFNTPYIASHPYILSFITATSRGVGVENELWLITEFHELGSLTDYLKVYTVTIGEALRFIETLATGLAFLHEDLLCNSNKPGSLGCKPAIAHRDFKSKNVLITNKKNCVIADFGLAVKFVPGESPGETHGQVGTRRYMAPEILEGAINFQRDAFLRIDMYAFALVLWEVITRCSDLPDGAAPIYLLPYEEELGQHPTMEEMQEAVVDKKIRPRIPNQWKQHPVIGLISETIEECWDHDVEARLSAGCVEERLGNLQRKTLITGPGEIEMQSNPISPPQITYSINDIERQNQINSLRNEMNFTEQSRLVSGQVVPSFEHSTPPPEYNSESNV